MLRLESGKSSVNQGYAILLSGEELDEVRSLFKDVPHVDHGEELEFSNLLFENVCDILIDYPIISTSTNLKKKLEASKPPLMIPKANPIPPKFKLQPRDYQIEAIKYGLEKSKFLLGDMMGMGKTSTMVFLAEILKAYYGFKHVLIICGINGAKYNWHMVEIPKFSYEKSHLIGSRINTKGKLVIGSVQERIEDIQKEHDEFYLITNIETLRNEDVVGALRYKIAQGEIGMVIIDEIHLASGRTSAQGKAIQHLKPKFRVGLTGTPIHNRPMELYNLLVWLGVEHRNFKEFMNEYAYEVPAMTMVNNRVVEFFKYVYKDLSMLHDRLKEVMLRRTEELLHLPTPVFKDEYVELDKEQIKVYNKIKEELLNGESYKSILYFKDIVTNPGVAFIKTRQVVSCPHIFGIKKDAKLERTIEIVDEALSNGKSVVIFAWFNETIDQYNRVLSQHFNEEYDNAILCVDKNTKNAQELIGEFQNATTPKVLIGTIGKLGTAFTITRADIVIFVDKHVIWSDYKQAYMRVWRQGQTKTVVIINILAKDTVDERLEQLNAIGKSHSDQVVDGKASDEYLDQQYGRLEDLL